MTNLFFAIYIFFELIVWIIIIDIILSWLTLLGIKFRPQFISSIIDPIYAFVRKHIPTRIGVFDLTPIIIIFFITFIVFPVLFLIHPPLHHFIGDIYNSL